MKVKLEQGIVTAKNEPHEWNFNDKTGITYRVEVSDGVQSFPLRCADVSVYNSIVVFHRYQMELDIIRRSGENGTYFQVVIANAVELQNR